MQYSSKDLKSVCYSFRKEINISALVAGGLQGRLGLLKRDPIGKSISPGEENHHN